MANKPYALTSEHFMAFGAIVQHFARHEYLMQVIISAIVDAEITPISMLTVELSYSARRNALLSVMKAKPIPKKQLEKIETFLSRLHKRSVLRNSIAHHVWKEGSRPGSIRSLGLSVRRGAPEVLGNDEEYTLEKLIKIANELGKLYDQFLDYLDKEGFLRSIPKNTQPKSRAISLSSGRPSLK
jgi:hypothetical protein